MSRKPLDQHMTLKNWQINAGYHSGLIGRVVQMHGLYYVGSGTVGPEFEADRGRAGPRCRWPWRIV